MIVKTGCGTDGLHCYRLATLQLDIEIVQKSNILFAATVIIAIYLDLFYSRVQMS